MERHGITFEGFVLRWLSAVALVLGTYNPSEFCLVAWIEKATANELPYLILTGCLFAIGFIVFLRATARSLGTVGLTMLLVFFGAFIWSLVNLGWINTDEHNVLLYAALLSIATIMAIGMSWSLIREEVTGQVDVNT